MRNLIKNPDCFSLGFLLLLMVALLPGCSTLGGSSDKASKPEIRSFLNKLVGAAWYEKFKNTEGRNPKIQLQVDRGVNAIDLKSKLLEDYSDRLTLVSSLQAHPDFRLTVHANKQAELVSLANSNKVWGDNAGNAVLGPPKPPILWSGFFIGPQVGYNTNMSSGGSGAISGSGGSALGGRLGWAKPFGSDNTIVWIPEFSIDVDQAVTSTVAIGTSTSPLSGTIGMVDYALDPLKFGWSFDAQKALLYLPIGGGLVQMNGGANGTTGYEGHIGLGLEYRISDHLAPYIEVIGEYGGASSLTSGSVTYPTSVSFFNIRGMVGVDWFPWVTRAGYLLGGE